MRDVLEDAKKRGEKIKTLRERQGLTQAQAAKLLRMSGSALHRLETGETKTIKADFLADMARVFGEDVSGLLPTSQAALPASPARIEFHDGMGSFVRTTMVGAVQPDVWRECDAPDPHASAEEVYAPVHPRHADLRDLQSYKMLGQVGGRLSLGGVVLVAPIEASRLTLENGARVVVWRQRAGVREKTVKLYYDDENGRRLESDEGEARRVVIQYSGNTDEVAIVGRVIGKWLPEAL